LFTVVSGVIVAGIALAFGLGAKTLVANIIGARHAQKYCRSSDHIQIAGVEGKVVEINSTMMVIETDQGRIMIPAKLYLEEISQVRHPVDKVVAKS
jgi:small-conductance mechanosensitive channel